MKVKAVYSFALLIPICGLLYTLTLGKQPASVIETIRAIIAADGCKAPCLFGHTLSNATYEEVVQLVKSSQWTRSAEINLGSYATGQDYIEWMWPPDTAKQLTAEGYPYISGWRNKNYIDFENGTVKQMVIVFVVSVKDIIAEFGDDFEIAPFALDHWYTTYALQYSALNNGIFEAALDCRYPQIEPTTPVLNYYYRATLSQDFHTRDRFPLVRWQGYETLLPDCTAFQP